MSAEVDNADHYSEWMRQLCRVRELPFLWRLCGESHFANRFYLEDLAVGRWRPLFNLDTER